MSAPALDDIVARVSTLPPLPHTVHHLLSVISDPSSSLAEIVDSIRYDQTLTAEVLRLCNSAYFGLARTVETLDDAVRLLGTAKVLQLVVAAHTRVMLSRPQVGYGLPAGALWQHSVAVALAGQRLGQRMRLPQAGLVFTAGLLHDVGKVVLNEFVAEEYAEIFAHVNRERCTFAEAEARVLGFTHPDVGSRLAEAWNLPPAITRCIRYHHDPQSLPNPDPLVDAVHLADAVCIALGIGAGDDGLAYRAAAPILRRYALAEADLELIGADTVAELKSVQAVLAPKR